MSGPPLLIAAQCIATLAGPVTAINQLSLRQAIAPPHLLGRVNATMRVIGAGMAPVGALIGGVLGTLIGLRAAILIGAIGMQIGFLILFLSPLRSLHAPPITTEEKSPAPA